MSRPNGLRRTLLLAIAGLLAPVATDVLAGVDPFYKQRHFYDEREQGYFWYQVDPPPPEPEKPVPPQPQAPSPAPEPERPKDPLTHLSPEDQVRSAMHSLMYEPTLEKAEAFLRYQNWVFEQAETVAQLFQQVLLLHPELNPAVERGRPVSHKGNQLAEELLQTSENQAMETVKDRMGLLFFFRSTCPYCKAEYPIIQRLARQGFFVQSISLDAAPLPNMDDRDFIPDTGMAEYFDISRVPTIVVVDPQRNVSAIVAVGYTTEDTILTRLHAFYDEQYGDNTNANGMPRPGRVYRPPTKQAGPDQRRYLEFQRYTQ